MFLKFGENPVIIASTAEAAKEIMKTHDSVFCTRPLSSSVKVATKHGMGIVFAPYGDHWRQMRKICFLELLSAKRIGSSRPVREEEAIRLIRSVSSASESDEQLVNLSKMLAALVHALSGALRQAEVLGESLMALMGRVIDEHLETRNSSGQEDLIDVLLRIQGEGNLEFPLTMSSIKQVIWQKYQSSVIINAWAICRDPECWDEPEAFAPERFIGSTRDYKGNNDFEFIPFGAGRRSCPGMLFGIANMQLALASLLFYFDWSLPDGVLPVELDMAESMGVTARRKLDLWLRPALRVKLP
ncbi:hypothetical protein ACQ4PT_071155 [Festuca glaucescens]